jgi:endoglycosylceramidase
MLRRLYPLLVTLIAAAILGAPGPARAVAGPSAVVAPAGAVGHAGRWLVDGDGRVVVVHGVNVPTKWGSSYPAGVNFGEDDVALLAAAGMNAVRLTVERYAVAPAPDRFDDGYLDHFADTVRLLAAHGILSLIDFHQDEWGPHFFDNGFPEWMTTTDGLPNFYQVGFPFQYFLNPALNRAFDHFWNNDVGPSGRPLQDDDARILAHVAARLGDLPGILGYEVINEPWPGSQYPTCVVPLVGCPLFDSGPLSQYYGRVIPALRAADPNHAVFYEPLTIFNEGVPTSVHPPDDANLGFAFHDYPLCGGPSDVGLPSVPGLPHLRCAFFDNIVMRNAESHAATTNSALLQTEFGNTFDTARLNEQLDVFDSHAVPWVFWSYNHFVVPEGPNGVLAPATRGNVVEPVLDALARPYPQLVAGTPVSWQFDVASRTFSLTYTTARADHHGAFGADAETAIAVPTRVYANGYRVVVHGARVISAPNAPVLVVAANAGARRVTVKVVRLPKTAPNL